MEQWTKNGWARFDKVEKLWELLRSMTPELKRHAGDPERISVVREHCRKSVEAFVEKFVKKGSSDGSGPD